MTKERWIGIDRHARPVMTPTEYQGHMAAVDEGDPEDMQIRCPHCRSVARVRSSRELSRLLRELYCQCSNVVCGHTFKSHVEVVKTLSPAACPDPGIEAQLAAAESGRAAAPLASTVAGREIADRLAHDARVAHARSQLLPAARDSP